MWCCGKADFCHSHHHQKLRKIRINCLFINPLQVMGLSFFSVGIQCSFIPICLYSSVCFGISFVLFLCCNKSFWQSSIFLITLGMSDFLLMTVFCWSRHVIPSKGCRNLICAICTLSLIFQDA